jgi:hypothetical protein
MSKGSSRRRLAALSSRKRAPEEWFAFPVEAYKVSKNRVALRMPKSKSRGRNG